MNTLIAVSIAPLGVGAELSEYVAEVVKVIRQSGLPNKTNSMWRSTSPANTHPSRMKSAIPMR